MIKVLCNAFSCLEEGKNLQCICNIIATVHSEVQSDLTASTQPIQTNVFMNIWTIQNSTGRIGPRSILYSVDM